MRRLFAGVAGALLLGLATIPASAAPIAGAATGGGVESGVVQVRYDRPSLPLAFWIWRCGDGHCGYWHRDQHRWQDGWHLGPRHVHREGHRRHYSRR